MSTHNICLYKEVKKKYTGCNLKTTECLDCVLIGVCAVLKSYFWYFRKCPGDRVVNASKFGSRGPVFESHWILNATHDYMAFHCTEHFIMSLPSSKYA